MTSRGGRATEREALEAAKHFMLDGKAARARAVSGGHIHDSFAVTCEGTERRYLLQRVNTYVFTDPDALAHNLGMILSHLDGHFSAQHSVGLVASFARRPMWRDPEGRLWRAFGLVEGCRSSETVDGPETARQVGRAYGGFHRAVLSFDGSRLAHVLPQLHDVGVHLAELRAAVEADPVGRVSGSRGELDVVRCEMELAQTSEELSAACEQRVVHGDAKVANVLLDASDGRAVGVVDLDTVRVASVFTDFGDMVRSAACPLPEDTTDLEGLKVVPALLSSLTEGYMEEAGDFLSDTERRSLVPAGRIAAFDQALRFLADHLVGDRYFSVGHPDHNLERCRAQLRLLSSLTGTESLVEQATAATRSNGHR